MPVSDPYAPGWTIQVDDYDPVPLRVPPKAVDPTATFVGAGVSLSAYGLSDTTTDISTVIAAAFADGKRHLVVPYRAAAWPALTTLNLTDIWLEFEPGARISFNHDKAGAWLRRSRLTRASFTSIYTGPASAADATNPTLYEFPAREVNLSDDSEIDGGYYQEYATNGIHFVGAHNRVNCDVTFKNMRHRQGWSAAIHNSGAAAFDNQITGKVYISDSDRGLENEDGAHDIQYLGGGYLKNVYPNGYTGQASAPSYAGYTCVLDGHSHQGNPGVEKIIFGGTWTLENCGAGATFSRSTGTDAATLPRGCRVDDLHIIGRALPSGSEDILLQGYGNHVGRVRFSEGAGIGGGAFRIKGWADSANNTVGTVIQDTEAARPTITDDGTGLRVGGQSVPLQTAQRAGRFLSFPSRPVTTSNALSNGTFRSVPVYVPYRIVIDQLGTEITAAGDTGSVMRLGIYSDLKGLPGDVLADTTVPADAVATPMATLGAPLTLDPGWYHIGGVVQGVTTTQPTVRVCSGQPADDRYLLFNPTITGATSPMGYSKGGVTGALGAWGTTVSTTNIAPRIWARVTGAV